MDDFPLLDSAARGMAQQRLMLDAAARNVAAAQASTPGHAYARLVAHFAARPLENDDSDGAAEAAPEMATFTTEPGSGDALTELIAVLDAQRAYEAHASIFDVGKRLAERTLDVGRS